ncbi:MAG TPA: hypothetical protein VNN80_33585 [Polyangiaceae bacterium]|nr:hypothetical protein [Polyangiaceae bacterium]
MFVCRQRVLPVAAVLSVSGCLPDEGPLFDPIAVQRSSPEGDAPSSAPAVTTPQAPLEAIVAAAEQPAASQLDAPLPAARPAPESAAAAPPPEPEAAAASAAADPCEADGVLACDTFEGSVAGQFPSGALWLPELSGCGTHQIDGSGPSFSGTNAVRADDGGYPECMLHADVGDADEIYVQSHVFLGPEPALLGEYLSLIELGPSATRDDPELRVGLRPATGGPCDGAPGVDLGGSGFVGGTPAACSGAQLERERWYCLEVHLARLDREMNVTVSVDGDAVLQQELVAGAAWDAPELFLKLGRAAYGASGSGALWHDDVVVSRAPISCAR